MKSIWENDIQRARFGALKGNKSTEVLIIGGGIAGVLCAYKLKNAGKGTFRAKMGTIKDRNIWT